MLHLQPGSITSSVERKLPPRPRPAADDPLERDTAVSKLQLLPWIRRWRSSVWSGWPEEAYNQPRYQQRLATVREHLAECIDTAPKGPVRIISMCAGDGRDLVGVLASHRRQADVVAWLVELNPESFAAGRRRASSAGLERAVRFLNEDATAFATYQQLAPADIVLACGVWGHVPADERAQLVAALTRLCKPGGKVIWTRGVSKGATRLHDIQSLFADSEWDQTRASLTSDGNWAVVTHCYQGPLRELPGHGQIFHFERCAKS